MTAIRGLPIEERIRLYDQAMELRKTMGWGKVRIGNSLGINVGAVGKWLYKGTNPRRVNGGYFNTADLEDSPRLAYVAGAVLGDGYLQKDSYRLGLRAKDRDFVELVERCLCEIVSGAVSFYTTEENDSMMYRVNTTCHKLYRWFERWGNIARVAEKFPADFIRGLADAEGSASIYWCKRERKWRRSLTITNSDRRLLILVSTLAKQHFDINFRLRVYKNRSQLYELRVCDKKNFQNFNDHVGFSIKRKKESLEKMLSSYKGVGR